MNVFFLAFLWSQKMGLIELVLTFAHLLWKKGENTFLDFGKPASRESHLHPHAQPFLHITQQLYTVYMYALYTHGTAHPQKSRRPLMCRVIICMTPLALSQQEGRRSAIARVTASGRNTGIHRGAAIRRRTTFHQSRINIFCVAAALSSQPYSHLTTPDYWSAAHPFPSVTHCHVSPWQPHWLMPATRNRRDVLRHNSTFSERTSWRAQQREVTVAASMTAYL